MEKLRELPARTGGLILRKTSDRYHIPAIKLHDKIFEIKKMPAVNRVEALAHSYGDAMGPFGISMNMFPAKYDESPMLRRDGKSFNTLANKNLLHAGNHSLLNPNKKVKIAVLEKVHPMKVIKKFDIRIRRQK